MAETVAKLRDKLVALGMPREKANKVKGKANVIEALEKLQNEKVVESRKDMIEQEALVSNFEDSLEGDDDEPIVLEDMFEAVSDTPAEETDDEPPMGVEHPRWTEHVLNSLCDDEKYDEKTPVVNGLRRIVESQVGEIVESDSDLMACSHDKLAVVKHTISVAWNFDKQDIRVFSSIASATPSNAGEYIDYLFAAADTMAESRALKRLLKLNKILVAEEASKGYNNVEPAFTDAVSDGANDGQLAVLETLCGDPKRGLDININKLIEAEIGSPKPAADLSGANVASLIQAVSKLQGEPDNIPEELRGYDSSWRTK